MDFFSSCKRKAEATITVRGISCSDGRVHYQTPGELEHPYGSTTVENLTSNYQLVEAGK